MKIIKSGEFQQGDILSRSHKHELPVHKVSIKSFAIGKFEVTFKEYQRYTISTGQALPHDEGWGEGSRPVTNVSWKDAMDYAAWLAKVTGKPYRLPTESEWEYAARSSGKDKIWAGTSAETSLTNYAVYRTNSKGRSAPVGEKNPNAFGLYDMTGNMYELVADCWHRDYWGAPTDGSVWAEENGGYCSERVLRGGSWYNQQEYLRLSYRSSIFKDFPNKVWGFRLAQDISN